MTEPRWPQRPYVRIAARQPAERIHQSEMLERRSLLRRLAASRPEAVLGVVAYWLGPEPAEGERHVGE